MKNLILKSIGCHRVVLTKRNKAVCGYAKISADDIKRVGQYRWCLNNKGYARAFINGKQILMHNFILGFKGVDHINLDRLDNRRRNLRPATASQNNMNKRLQKNNRSGVRGVWYHPKSVSGKTYKYWEAYLSIGRKNIFLGCFKNKKDAQVVREKAEIKYFKNYRHGAV